MCQRKCRAVLILVCFVTFGQCAFNHVDIIQTFAVRHKQMSAVNLLLCKNAHLVETSRRLMDSGAQVKALRVKDISIEREMHDTFTCSEFRKIIVLDLECAASESLLLGLMNRTLFSACNHWLLLENLRSVPFNVFEQLPISLSTEVTLATRDPKMGFGNASSPSGIYWLYDIWSTGISLGGALNVTFIGKYEPQVNGGNFQLATHETTLMRRHNLQGLALRCMLVLPTKLEEPFDQFLASRKNPEVDSLHRFNYVVHTFVRDMFNFTMLMRHAQSWGYMKNGTITEGMIGYLVRGQAEIGGSPGFFRIERHERIDYTVGTWIERPCFIFRHPDTAGLVRNVFLIPFTNYVWICILVVGFFCLIVTSEVISVERIVISSNTDGVNGAARRGNSSSESGCIASNFIFRNVIKSFAQYCSGNKSKLCCSTSDDTRRKPNSYDKFKKDKADGAEGRAKESDAHASEGGDLLFRTPDRLRASRRATLQRFYRQPARVEAPIDAQLGGKAVTIGARPNIARRVSGKEHNVIKIHNSHAGIIENYEKEKSASRSHPVAQVQRPYLAESYSRSVVLFIRAMSQQGIEDAESPTNIFSGRLVMQILVLFGFFIFQFYSASIVASLLMEKPKTIKTIRNLMDSSLELGVVDNPYNHDFFVRTTDQDALELFRTRIEYKKKNNEMVYQWFHAADGLTRTKKGGFAFHVDVASAYKIIRETFTEKEICELSEIQLFPPGLMMSMVQKNSPYRKMVTYGLRKVVETGLLYRERHFWHAQQPKCTRQIHSADLIVGLDALTSAFALLMFGIGLSICLLCIELTYKCLQSRWRRT
ncbi:ionotropic receptor 75a-like [Phlebotomus argentipes]|uniref:ionotropic receptor 75a-like n=1 Tax=Phlebotomus argentipes TaxID=94469 RepID=UPI002892B336|nr:ionotropic receptor 75a-like [Phlebotomus argentipes]